MFLQIEYIRRFLCTINKTRVYPSNTSFKHLNEALNYKVQTVFESKNKAGSIANTITVMGMHNKKYIVKIHAILNNPFTYIIANVGKMCTFLHKIQLVSDTPLTLDICVKGRSICSHNTIENSVYFKHPLPMSLFTYTELHISFYPKPPSALIMYQSVWDSELETRMYYWTPQCKVTVHSLLINPIDNCLANIDNDCKYTPTCKCKHLRVRKQSTFLAYSIPEKYLCDVA